MNEMRPKTDAEIAVRDELLLTADAILAAAGIKWTDDNKRYAELKRAILDAADEYHMAMTEAQR